MGPRIPDQTPPQPLPSLWYCLSAFMFMVGLRISSSRGVCPHRQVFLFCSTGIACLHLKFVDGRGNPIQLIPTARPSPRAYRDVMDKHMFEGMVQTNLYHVKPGSRSPGEKHLLRAGHIFLSLHFDKTVRQCASWVNRSFLHVSHFKL